ncbi:hypothetical protein LJC34_05515 [Oscillospiraceae bacterium OttesenSCG-928-G22]|nr:hypothetical protein [Oscillospiraceae bacterium OttesenSCG-928-G22]
MSTHISIDIETYSSVDLRKAGLYPYVEAPDFQILLLAYAVDDGPVQIIDLANGGTLDSLRAGLTDGRIIKHAYNASFEWRCLGKHLGFSENEALAWLSQLLALPYRR